MCREVVTVTIRPPLVQIRSRSFSLRVIAFCWEIVVIHFWWLLCVSFPWKLCSVYPAQLYVADTRVSSMDEWKAGATTSCHLLCKPHTAQLNDFSQGSPSTLNVLCPVLHSKYLNFQGLVMSTVIPTVKFIKTFLGQSASFDQVLYAFLPAYRIHVESFRIHSPHSSPVWYRHQRVDGVEGTWTQDPDYHGFTLD